MSINDNYKRGKVFDLAAARREQERKKYVGPADAYFEPGELEENENELEKRAQEDAPEFAREEKEENNVIRREKLRKRGKSALTLFLAALIVAIIGYVGKKFPDYEVVPTLDDDEGTHSVSFDKNAKSIVDNKINEYRSKVKEILANTKGGFSMQSDGTVEAFIDYLLQAADSDFNYRLAVYAASRTANSADFPILFNGAARILSEGSNDGLTPLSNVKDLTEYYSTLQYSGRADYQSGERNALVLMYMGQGLSDVEATAAAILTTGGR